MIRDAKYKDIEFLVKLASLPEVWGGTEEELREDFEQLLDSEKDLVAVAEYSGEIVGFANIRLRSEYVAGTKSSPVAYLEGIAVSEEFRGKGIAKKLFEFCAAWAKEKGCTEFGSDCLLTNEASYAFHMAMGFKEIERTVHFAKTIYKSSLVQRELFLKSHSRAGACSRCFCLLIKWKPYSA